MMTRAKKVVKLSAGEEEMALVIRALKFPAPEREYRFWPKRMWRFDFAWPDIMLAIEIDGVTGGAGGRHQRIEGFKGDCRKSNIAVVEGWRVLRFTPDMVKSGEAADMLEPLFAKEKHLFGV